MKILIGKTLILLFFGIIPFFWFYLIFKEVIPIWKKRIENNVRVIRLTEGARYSVLVSPNNQKDFLFGNGNDNLFKIYSSVMGGKLDAYLSIVIIVGYILSILVFMYRWLKLLIFSLHPKITKRE